MNYSGGDEDMRVPEFVRDCVVFVGAAVPKRKGGGFDRVLFGTAFWMIVKNADGPSGSSSYLITAAHVARAIESYPRWFIRLNGPDGHAQEINKSDRWHYHDDPSVDVAVLPVEPPAHLRYEVMIRPESIVWPDDSLRSEVDVGDEVFVTGLFSPMEREKRNLPIVRTGNIAMMPGTDRIPVNEHKVNGHVVSDVEGYLIEARSIGGLSGSPCFVRPTVQTEDKRDPLKTRAFLPRETRPLGLSEEVYLLGLMQGHWDIQPQAKNDRAGDDEGPVNMGIAIVVPAPKIAETMRQPQLEALRIAEARKQRAKYEQEEATRVAAGRLPVKKTWRPLPSE